MNIIDTKSKREIYKFLPRLKRIHTQKRCFLNWKYAREITTKLMFELPHKYKKDYLIYLESTYTLDTYNIQAFEFVLKHFNDIVRYIENSDKLIHNDVIEFIFCFYKEYDIQIPSIVNFRDIMSSVTEYFFSFLTH